MRSTCRAPSTCTASSGRHVDQLRVAYDASPHTGRKAVCAHFVRCAMHRCRSGRERAIVASCRSPFAPTPCGRATPPVSRDARRASGCCAARASRCTTVSASPFSALAARARPRCSIASPACGAWTPGPSSTDGRPAPARSSDRRDMQQPSPRPGDIVLVDDRCSRREPGSRLAVRDGGRASRRSSRRTSSPASATSSTALLLRDGRSLAPSSGCPPRRRAVDSAHCSRDASRRHR